MGRYSEQIKSWWKHILILVSGILLFVMVFYSTILNLRAEETPMSGTCGEKLNWKISENDDSFKTYNEDGEQQTCNKCYTLTISGSGAMNNYSNKEVSDQEQPQPWKEFGGNITRIVVEENVTSIGNNAFSWTEHLISVSLPEGLLSIGDYAFQGCCYGKEEGDCWQVIGGLPAITIPGSVTSIGNNAFCGNWNLKTVNYEGENLVSICPEGTDETGNEWSDRDRLDNVFGGTPWFEAWKNSERMHGTCGAEGENLTWEISENDDIFEFYNYEAGILETSDDGYTLTISGTGAMQDYNYYDAAAQGEEVHDPEHPWEEFRFNITQVIVEEGVTRIGDCAFKWNDQLRKVSLPKSLISIGDYAFYECITEKPVDEGQDLEIIGYLSEIEIPSSVTEIGEGVFAGYRDKTVTIKGVPGSSIDKYVQNVTDNFNIVFVDACAKGHRLKAVAERPATDTTAGNKAYWYCEVCDKYFSDAEGENEITLESIVIPITPNSGGHTHTIESHEGKEATCTEAGWEAYETCKNCDYTTYEEIPAKGHNVEGRGGKAATCSEDGLTEEKYCSVCGEILEAQRPILATGHNWDAGTVNGNTTTYKCTVCGVTKTKEEVVDDILDHATTVVDSLNKDNLTDDDKSTVIQTVGNVLDKMGTASEIQEKMEMDTIASIEELYISSENKVTSSTVKGDYASSSSDIKVEGAALTAKQYIEENSDDTTYNTEIRINEDTKSVDLIPELKKTDYVLDISMNIIKTTSDNKAEIHKEDIQPAAPVRMTIPVPKNYIGTTFKLYHFENDGAKKEDVPYTLSENKKSLTFVVSSLSPFAFVKVSEPEVVPPTIQKVESIHITGLSHSIAAGKKVKLTATVLPKTAANKKVVWTSSNKKVATVSQSGVVTVLKKTGGKSVIITAAAADGSGKKATFKINSKKGVVTKVTISGKKTLSVGKSMKLKASVKATKGAYKAVKWTSSNPKYATVSSKGVVKALKAGKGKTVKITAMAMDGSGKKATIKIKLKKR